MPLTHASGIFRAFLRNASGESYTKRPGSASGVLLPGLSPDYSPADGKRWNKSDEESDSKCHRFPGLIGSPGSQDFLFQQL